MAQARMQPYYSINQNSQDSLYPRGNTCGLLGKSAEGATYVLQKNCIATVSQHKKVGNGNGRSHIDNNALRGHMILVPIFGCIRIV
jgi:hypothetical protein